MLYWRGWILWPVIDREKQSYCYTFELQWFSIHFRKEIQTEEYCVIYNHNDSDNNKSRKIFINQSLCPYYRNLYVLVKDLSNEGLIDSSWILNGTIKIRESSQSKPVSITHESDLLF